MNLKYQMLASEASAFVPRLESLARSIDNSPRRSHNANVAKGLRLLRAVILGHDNAAFPQRANAPINPLFQRQSFSASIGGRLRYDRYERTINIQCVLFFFDCFGFERQNVAPVEAPTFTVGHASDDEETVRPENVDDLVCFKVLCFVCVCVCVCECFCQQLMFFSFENRSKVCRWACRCKLCRCRRCSTRSKSTKGAILNEASNSRSAVFLAAVCAFDCVVVVECT